MKPKKFCSAKNVTVYHVHKEGFGKGRETLYWYSTSIKNSQEHYEYDFDVRDLGYPHASKADWDNPDGSYNPNWLPAWEERLKAFIRSCIHEGRIKSPCNESSKSENQQLINA